MHGLLASAASLPALGARHCALSDWLKRGHLRVGVEGHVALVHMMTQEAEPAGREYTAVRQLLAC